jgi:hypothetical protein
MAHGHAMKADDRSEPDQTTPSSIRRDGNCAGVRKQSSGARYLVVGGCSTCPPAPRSPVEEEAAAQQHDRVVDGGMRVLVRAHHGAGKGGSHLIRPRYLARSLARGSSLIMG